MLYAPYMGLQKYMKKFGNLLLVIIKFKYLNINILLQFMDDLYIQKVLFGIYLYIFSNIWYVFNYLVGKNFNKT